MLYSEWHGAWWAVQWHPSISVGFHLEPRWTLRTNSGIPYGPYLDLHLPCLTVSIGRNPIYAGELDLLKSYSRGGLCANCH